VRGELPSNDLVMVRQDPHIRVVTNPLEQRRRTLDIS